MFEKWLKIWIRTFENNSERMRRFWKKMEVIRTEKNEMEGKGISLTNGENKAVETLVIQPFFHTVVFRSLEKNGKKRVVFFDKRRSNNKQKKRHRKQNKKNRWNKSIVFFLQTIVDDYVWFLNCFLFILTMVFSMHLLRRFDVARGHLLQKISAKNRERTKDDFPKNRFGILGEQKRSRENIPHNLGYAYFENDKKKIEWLCYFSVEFFRTFFSSYFDVLDLIIFSKIF